MGRKVKITEQKQEGISKKWDKNKKEKRMIE